MSEQNQLTKGREKIVVIVVVVVVVVVVVEEGQVKVV